MSPKVVVLGGLNMDLVVRTPRLPRPGETVEATSFATTPGGKGANQAVAAARALVEERLAVAMVGRVGDDDYGAGLLEFLDAEAIDSTRVERTAGTPSGIAIVFTDAGGQNTVTAIYGANAACGAREADAAASLLGPGVALLVQQETPLAPTLAAMQAARNAGATVILDPAPARKLPRGFLRYADIVTPNQVEAEALSGVPVVDIESARIAGGTIRRRHHVDTVIVTLGELGALVTGSEIDLDVPAFPVRALESVAAGDAFNGALAAALATGETLEAAVRFAAAAGALSVTRAGAGASMPYGPEIRELLRRG